MNKRNYILEMLSLACAVHCLLAPAIVIFVPFMGSFFENVWIELLILFSSIIIGSIIIYKGFCQHKRRHVCILFIIGIMFWISHLGLDFFDMHEFEWILFFIGSFFVVGSYYFNHRNLKCCSH